MVGIIRSARRPAGWVPGGPRPAGTRGLPELEPADDEDLCFLSGEWRLFQKQKGHRWSIDDLVTAHVASTVAPEQGHALDLGCGLGSVLLMLAWRRPSLEVTGIEAQPERAAMARRSIAYNGADDRCRVLDGDLRKLELGRRFELVTGTPPYFPLGTGTQAPAEHVSACRFEHRGGVEVYLSAIERHLAPTGHAVICTASLEEDRVQAWAGSLSLRRITRVIPREGKHSLITVWTFSFAGGVIERDVLTVRDQTGQWTPEFRQVREGLGLPPAPP